MLYIENKNLSSLNVIKDMLAKHGLYAKKKYGQNFLADENILQKIVDAGDITGGDLIIEIGPGLGVLTAALAKKAGKVIAIEIDDGIIPVLNDNMSGLNNVEIINTDVLKLDLSELIEKQGFKATKIIANLPYYITTPVIFAVLESGANIESMVVMVQKEVGERMKAKPSTKSYGALTLLVEYYADITTVAAVPPSCFYPKPGVESIIIKFDLLKKPRVCVSDKEKLFRVIKASFAMRRKTLVNCLVSAKEFKLSKEKATELLKKLGLSENIRGEALTLKQFADIANKI